MAYLHGKQPRPTAPVKARTMTVAERRSILSTGSAVRFALVFAMLSALFLVGRAAALATESLAIGIIAADLLFLIAVAGWSAVAVVTRH